MRGDRASPPPAGGRGPGGGPAPAFKKRDTTRARELRNTAPLPGRRLRQALRNRSLGVRFSRQMPVGPYSADFLCRELKLIVEIDGVSHDQEQDYDARRDRYCKGLGYEVLRFQNAEMMGNLEGVVSSVREAVARMAAIEPTPDPSRMREGGVK